MININRRTFLAYTAALAGVASYPTRSDAENFRTRLILLGTGGGPRPRKANAPSAQVIVANGTAYVIDCGNGVARQLAIAEYDWRHIGPRMEEAYGASGES